MTIVTTGIQISEFKFLQKTVWQQENPTLIMEYFFKNNFPARKLELEVMFAQRLKHRVATQGINSKEFPKDSWIVTASSTSGISDAFNSGIQELVLAKTLGIPPKEPGIRWQFQDWINFVTGTDMTLIVARDTANFVRLSSMLISWFL